jgi:hypothetical protein
MRYTPALLAALAAAPVVHAQPELACNGFDNVVYAGDQVQDYLIPNIADVTVFFTVQGADGGRAVLDAVFDGNDQDWPGGEGAQAVIGVRIGNDPGQIAPGGTIRFIVGKKGDDVFEDTSFGADVAAAGGGGGSAVLYLPPNGSWANDGVILAAAGGGGGACAADLSTRGPGFDANAGECGDDLVNGTDVSMGGCNGLGGQGRFGGGGAGAFGNGGPGGFNPDFQGKLGFPSGGTGGTSNAGNGGWGFGGGGAGGGTGAGGGGGYSGGAAACCSSIDDPEGPAGGGGSYINQVYAAPGSGTLEGFSPRDDNGFAQYVIDRFIRNNQPQFPDQVFDNTPVNGAFCGAQDSGAADCGPNIDGADLWYTYTSPIDCSPADIMIMITSGDAEIQSYNSLTGNPTSSADCRGASTNGVYLDTLNPGQTIRFRVQSATGNDFTLVTSSDFATGQTDCDGNGIPDACDIAANPGLDCNGNGRPDSCDIADGTSQDCDSDGIPDECDPSDDCPPPNDDRANALAITPGSYFYDMEFSTLDGTASCRSDGIDGDIWYTFTAPSDGQLIAEQDVNGFGILVSLSLFDQSGNELACNRENFVGDADSRVVWPMSAGETVVIRVDGSPQKVGFGITEGTLNVTFVDGLTNDRCEGAIDAVLDTPYVFDPFLLEDTNDPVVASCVPDSAIIDQWYRYTSQNGGLTRFQVDDPFVGITVFDACGGNELGCDRGFGTGSPPPTVELEMSAGESVIIRLAEIAFLNTATFVVEEQTTCGMADLDMDGDLDFFDVSAFLNAFNAMEPVADFTGDGVFDFFDVSAFLNAYNAGCP